MLEMKNELKHFLFFHFDEVSNYEKKMLCET